MISRLNLYDVNGNKINMESLGLFGLKLQVPSPSYAVQKEIVDGGKIIIVDKQLNPRNLTAEFMTKANDFKDSFLLRDELFKLLGNGEEIYISEINVPGKRWRVSVEDWAPERVSRRVSKVDIPLTANDGVSESVHLFKKKYTSASFVYKNEGNRIIDPRKHLETEIIFKGPSTDLTITNKTTGEVWKYNGSTSSTDIIKLKGVQAFKNNSSTFGQTNKKLITLAVGNNEFTVSGATGSFELEISTRFYFL